MAHYCLSASGSLCWLHNKVNPSGKLEKIMGLARLKRCIGSVMESGRHWPAKLLKGLLLYCGVAVSVVSWSFLAFCGCTAYGEFLAYVHMVDTRSRLGTIVAVALWIFGTH